MLRAEDVLQDAAFDLLDPVVERLHCECVRIDGQQKKQFVQRFQNVLERIIHEMKECDSSFARVFNRIGFTGSFYDGVRVAHATEFDLNLVLEPSMFKMDIVKARPGFIDITVKGADKCEPERTFGDWVVGGRLSPRRVRHWLHSVTAKAVDRVGGVVNGSRVRLTRSGPAATLWVRGDGGELSIDLVPVLEFPASRWPPAIPRKPKKLLGAGYEKNWFAVPKGSDSWRMSFPIQERQIIKGLEYFKYNVRLIKKMRDQLGVNQVASYYVKTLFLYELENNVDSRKEFWAKTRRGRLFVYMLCRLRDALNAGEIMFFWDTRLNLLEEVRGNTLRNSYGRVNNFLTELVRLVRARDKIALRDFVLPASAAAAPPPPQTAAAPPPQTSCCVQ